MTSGIILTVLSIAGVEEGIVKAVFGSDVTALLCTWHLLERNLTGNLGQRSDFKEVFRAL